MKKLLILLLCFLLCGCNVVISEKTETSDEEVNETSGVVEETSDVYKVTLTGHQDKKTKITTEKDVEIILDNISSEFDGPTIKIINANSVKITLIGESTIVNTNSEKNAIVSYADLTFDGDGILNVNSTGTALKSKSNLTINSGTFNLNALNDGLHANETLTINGGNITILGASEGVEATQIIINDGILTVEATDDGFNASQKSETLSPIIEINGGTISITMGQGDTDGLDSNGYIYVNGGTISVNGQNTFDAEMGQEFNGGTVIINGEEVDELPEDMMGGGGFGGPGGNFNHDGDMPSDFDPDNLPEGFDTSSRPERPDNGGTQPQTPNN